MANSICIDSDTSDDEPLSKLIKKSSPLKSKISPPLTTTRTRKAKKLKKNKNSAHKLIQTLPVSASSHLTQDKTAAEKKNIIWSIIRNEQFLRSWTGLSYFQQLESVEEYAQFELDLLPDIRKITTLSVKEKILLVFIKLTTNLTYMNIAGMFNITHYSVGRVFHSMLPILKLALESSAFFPSYDEITEKINVLLRSTANSNNALDFQENTVPNEDPDDNDVIIIEV